MWQRAQKYPFSVITQIFFGATQEIACLLFIYVTSGATTGNLSKVHIFKSATIKKVWERVSTHSTLGPNRESRYVNFGKCNAFLFISLEHTAARAKLVFNFQYHSVSNTTFVLIPVIVTCLWWVKNYKLFEKSQETCGGWKISCSQIKKLISGILYGEHLLENGKEVNTTLVAIYLSVHLVQNEGNKTKGRYLISTPAELTLTSAAHWYNTMWWTSASFPGWMTGSTCKCQLTPKISLLYTIKKL